MDRIQCSLESTKKRQVDTDGSGSYDFCFLAVPESKVGTPLERESTYPFKVELKVTPSLMASEQWRNTSVSDKELHFFQYVKENLEKANPPSREETIRLPLNTYSDGSRFNKGPVYSTEHIDPRQPFIISPHRRIGF